MVCQVKKGERKKERKRGNSNMKNRSNRRKGGKERVREGTIGEGREEDRKTKKEKVIREDSTSNRRSRSNT